MIIPILLTEHTPPSSALSNISSSMRLLGIRHFYQIFLMKLTKKSYFTLWILSNDIQKRDSLLLTTYNSARHVCQRCYQRFNFHLKFRHDGDPGDHGQHGGGSGAADLDWLAGREDRVKEGQQMEDLLFLPDQADRHLLLPPPYTEVHIHSTK